MINASAAATVRRFSVITCRARFNALGDISDKGNKESATLMVNYLYDLQKIEDWHEDYAGEGKRNASVAVRRLARGWA